MRSKEALIIIGILKALGIVALIAFLLYEYYLMVS